MEGKGEDAFLRSMRLKKQKEAEKTRRDALTPEERHQEDEARKAADISRKEQILSSNDFQKDIRDFSCITKKKFNDYIINSISRQQTPADNSQMAITFDKFDLIDDIKKEKKLSDTHFFIQDDYIEMSYNHDIVITQDENTTLYELILKKFEDILMQNQFNDNKTHFNNFMKTRYFAYLITDIKQMLVGVIDKNIDSHINDKIIKTIQTGSKDAKKIKHYTTKYGRTQEDLRTIDRNSDIGLQVVNNILRDMYYSINFISNIFDDLYAYITINEYNVIFIDLENLCIMKEYTNGNTIMNQNNVIALILEIIKLKYSDPRMPKLFPIFCTNNKQYSGKSFFYTSEEYNFCLLTSLGNNNEVDDYNYFFLTLLMKYNDYLKIYNYKLYEKSLEYKTSLEYEETNYDLLEDLKTLDLTTVSKFCKIYLIFTYDNLGWTYLTKRFPPSIGDSVLFRCCDIYRCELDRFYNFIRLDPSHQTRSPPFRNITHIHTIAQAQNRTSHQNISNTSLTSLPSLEQQSNIFRRRYRPPENNTQEDYTQEDTGEGILELNRNLKWSNLNAPVERTHRWKDPNQTQRWNSETLFQSGRYKSKRYNLGGQTNPGPATARKRSGPVTASKSSGSVTARFEPGFISNILSGSDINSKLKKYKNNLVEAKSLRQKHIEQLQNTIKDFSKQALNPKITTNKKKEYENKIEVFKIKILDNSKYLQKKKEIEGKIKDLEKAYDIQRGTEFLAQAKKKVGEKLPEVYKEAILRNKQQDLHEKRLQQLAERQYFTNQQRVAQMQPQNNNMNGGEKSKKHISKSKSKTKKYNKKTNSKTKKHSRKH
jgi:hypothetical protein